MSFYIYGTIGENSPDIIDNDKSIVSTKNNDLITDMVKEDNLEIAKKYMAGQRARFLLLSNILFGILGTLLGCGIQALLTTENKTQITAHISNKFISYIIISPFIKWLSIILMSIIFGAIYNHKRLKQDYLFVLSYIFCLSLSFNIVYGFYIKSILNTDEDKSSRYEETEDKDENFFYMVICLFLGIITSICFTIFFEELYKYKKYFMYISLFIFILQFLIVSIYLDGRKLKNITKSYS